MALLIIDDDPNKMRQLRSFINKVAPQILVEERVSFQSGLKYCMVEMPEFVVLDMTMSTYIVGGSEPGGKDRRYAGEEILRRLRRAGRLIPTVVMTQFEQFGEGENIITLDELRQRLARDFPDQFLGAIYYQASDSGWQSQLLAVLQQNFR